MSDQDNHCEPAVAEAEASNNNLEVPKKARRKSKTNPLLKCPHCAEERSCKSVLARHIATHKLVLHKCDKCEQSFNHKGNLQRHVKRTHSRPHLVVAHVCPLCQRLMTEYTVLRQHLVKVHKMANDEARVKARGCTFNVLPQTGALNFKKRKLVSIAFS